MSLVLVVVVHLLGRPHEGQLRVLRQEQVAAKDATQGRPRNLVETVTEVILVGVGLKSHLELAHDAIDQDLEDEVLGLLLEAIVDFCDLVAPGLSFIDHSVGGLLDVLQGLEHALASDEVSDVAGGGSVLLAPVAENDADLLGPHLDQVLDHCGHAQVLGVCYPLVDVVDDGLLPLLYFLEHLLHHPDIHLESLSLLVRQLQVGLGVVPPALRADLVDQLLELGQHFDAGLVDGLYLLDQVAIVLEVLNRLEEVDALFCVLLLEIDAGCALLRGGRWRVELSQPVDLGVELQLYLLDLLVVGHLLVPEVLAEHEGNEAEVLHVLFEHLKVDPGDIFQLVELEAVFVNGLQDLDELGAEIAFVKDHLDILTRGEQVLELGLEGLSEVLYPFLVLRAQITEFYLVLPLWHLSFEL